MDVGAIYYLIYYILITILTFSECAKYSKYNHERVSSTVMANNIGLIVLTLILIIWIGFRPSSPIFTDMSNYIATFYVTKGNIFEWNWHAENKLFDNIMYWMSSKRLSPVVLFFTTSVVYFGAMAKACLKIFPKDALLAFLVYLAAFSTLSYGTNGIKAGAAASVFLLAIAYRDKRIVSYLFLLLSWSIHHSMFFPIAGFFCVTYYKNSKVYLVFWLFAVLCAAAHITVFQEIFASASDAKGASYLSADGTNYFRTTNFRPDFVLYSALPVYLGYKMTFKNKIQSEGYSWLLNLYLLLNGIWMLCMYAEFTNRIAYLSWFLYPILTIYPYLNEEVCPNQYKELNAIVCFQLFFSIFMFFVYYNLLGF